MENKTKIILTRRSEWQNRPRAFAVLIDGVEAGAIKSGSSEEYALSPGNHRIQCKLAWYSSPEFMVDLKQNEIQYLAVRGGMKYYWHLFGLLLAGVFINLIYSGPHYERLLWVVILKFVLILPALLYMLYYLTIGRKKYIIIEEDKDNVFAG